MKLLAKARAEGMVKIEPPVFANLTNAFDNLETKNRRLLNYGWVNFPLAYTQVTLTSKMCFTNNGLTGLRADTGSVRNN